MSYCPLFDLKNLVLTCFFHFNQNKTIPIFVNISLLYPGKMKVFRCKLESPCLSIQVSVCFGTRPGGRGTGIFDTSFFFGFFAFFLHVLGYFNTLEFLFFLSISSVTRDIYSVSFGIAEIIQQSDFHFFVRRGSFLINKTM